MITVLQIFPNYMTHGGMEAFLMNYFRHCNKEEITFVFLQLSNRKGEFDEEIISSGGFVEYYSFNQHNIAKYSKFLKTIINKYHIDLVHVHGDAYSVMTYFCLRLIGYKNVIAHSHNTNQPSHFLLKTKKKLTTKLSRYHFACSLEAGQWLFGDKNISKDTFYIINNAIDVNHYAFDSTYRNSIRNELNILDTDFVIGCVGHLVDNHKNQSFLIKLMPTLIKSHNCKLILIGDGDDYMHLLQLTQKLLIDDAVIFLRNVNDASKYYSAFDCFCLPSHYEGLGIVCVEAIASGLRPIISENVPIIPELSTFERCLPLSDDVSKWEVAIMESKRDTKQINELLRSTYSIQTASKRLVEIYKAIIYGKAK